MSEEKGTGKLKATHHGKLKLAGTILDCDVLNDGKRVISQNAIYRSFGRTSRGRGTGESRVRQVPGFIDAQNLQSYVGRNLRVALKPVNYLSTSGKSVTGYSADIVPLICDVYLKAREDENLRPNQAHLAHMAEVLVRALSKVGIVALVDEATGYQLVRDKDELSRILEAYVRKEFLPWTKRFPDEFYEQIFRLQGWTYNPLTVKRPQIIGKLTNELVYEKLPPGVLEALKKKTPKSDGGNYTKRFHQSLTPEIGNPHLERHLASLITLMRISPNLRVFQRNFVRAFGGQLELEFPDQKE